MTRRLAAILAADIAGYSRLMHEDEQATHARFTQAMNDAVEPAIAQHGGRIVKSTGDGFLAEFASAVEAVGCALQFQDGIARITADDDEDHRLAFRVGVHIGEVIVEARDIYGDGVNIAARLEGLAEPGGILVSEAVHENVRGRLPCEFDDLGAQQVKNIARPMRLFRVLSATLRTQAAGTRPALREKPSIVVLPFQNLSDDAQQDYFSDGIVEDITNALSRFRWLFVIARNSAFTYKGRAVDVRQVGRELGARYVVEGSLRKIASRLRITGQAIQTDTGANLWAERYDRDLTDVFALQDEMTATIVSALVPSIQRAEIERARHKPPGSLDGYDLHLCALAADGSMTREGNEAARVMLDQALALDPNCVPALVLADGCWGTAVANGWLPPDSPARSLRHARLAVQLEPEDAEALATLAARMAVLTLDDEQAVALAERAIATNPHSATVLRKSGQALLHAGRAEDSLALFERSLRLGPGDPAACNAWSGMALAWLSLGRHADAITAGRRAAQYDPAPADALRVLTAALALAGRHDEARVPLGRLWKNYPVAAVAAVRLGPRLRERGGRNLLDGLRDAGAAVSAADDEPTVILRAGREEPRRVLRVSRTGEPDDEVTIGDMPLVLGRAPESDVVLNDPKVSRAHCRIMLTDGEVIATDLRSTNGTFVDGRPIEGAARLLPGTVLRIGPYEVSYWRSETSDPERTLLAAAEHEADAAEDTAQNPAENPAENPVDNPDGQQRAAEPPA